MILGKIEFRGPSSQRLLKQASSFNPIHFSFPSIYLPSLFIQFRVAVSLAPIPGGLEHKATGTLIGRGFSFTKIYKNYKKYIRSCM